MPDVHPYGHHSAGIIIAATIIVAAGIAVYESPQVRELVNKGRRRIAIALHTLGEEIHPNTRRPSSDSGDHGPEAEELRQLRRAELVERNRDQFLRQREAEIAPREKSKRRTPESGYASFDDFLTQDAEKAGTYTIRNTSVAHPDHEEGLRRRTEGVRGLERGGAFANPFADPIGEEEASQVLFDATLMGASHESLHNEKIDNAMPRSRETTATLPAEPLGEIQPPPVEAPTPPLNPSTPNTATSSPDPPAQPFQPSAYWSVVHEWAENTSPSYYNANPNGTPEQQSGEHPHHQEPQPQQQQQHLEVSHNNNTSPTSSSTPSLAGSCEEVHPDDISTDGDAMSEVGGASSVGSWTEVGSEVSEGDHGGH
ncbi:hypothetical protein FGG08_004615 [Glutinoglossum americanum]|uniref:Uncharacterized protein n=1 Tax=Glutinoglossum americanum TaxID=1670608 RepID=A0A9P8KZB8_9PEZI|nr:hypothetical protein FGG08_004615 [Glutinoglossum americanum]